MIPVIALVGRTNVGKSTLFNRLTHSRQALVINQPQSTRDRIYGYGQMTGEHPFIVIDTGGMSTDQTDLAQLVQAQCDKAINEADIILLVVDYKTGLVPMDQTLIQKLRRSRKPMLLIVNKCDNPEAARDAAVISEFYSLGLKDIYPISATHGQGVEALLQKLLSLFPQSEAEPIDFDMGIKVAIVGKPNVGKSTLINRILGEDRVIVSEIPGTTRDSIYVPFERQGQKFTLIDTAGIRKRGKVKETIETFSILKTLKSIQICHVVLFVIDARQNISDQDLSLIGHILEQGKALVIAINKWDGLTESQKSTIQNGLDRRLMFLNFARQHFISALHGTNVGLLFDSILEAYQSASHVFATHAVTETLEKLVEKHPAPMVRGRRIKLRYAHMGGHHPPVIVIFGNQIGALPRSYMRYLENGFRKELNLMGTPITLEFKQGENPYA